MVVNPTSTYYPKTSPIYANSDPMSDLNNTRLRPMNPNLPIQTTQQPAHFVLSTGDFHLNEKEQELHHSSPNKHKKSHVALLILMAFLSLLQNFRSNIPEHLETSSEFWSHIKPVPISRVDTIDIRPNANIENFLFQFAEVSQTLWFIYLLSFIPRRTHLGYLYRNPDVFNVPFCSLLITVMILQIISQTPVPAEVSCACLFASSVLLIISCRLIAVKLVKYEEKFRQSDLLILRYFVLNSLFLSTTSIIYLTICSSIEYIAFHFDPTAQSLSTTTSIGFAVFWVFFVIYYLLDQLVYYSECRSIWTPYLFLAMAFHFPLIRQLFHKETIFKSNDRNYYLLWILSSTILLFIIIRIGRQLSMKYRASKRRNSFTSEKSLETKNE